MSRLDEDQKKFNETSYVRIVFLNILKYQVPFNSKRRDMNGKRDYV